MTILSLLVVIYLADRLMEDNNVLSFTSLPHFAKDLINHLAVINNRKHNMHILAIFVRFSVPLQFRSWPPLIPSSNLIV